MKLNANFSMLLYCALTITRKLFTLCFSFYFVDLMFTLLSNGKILKASTLTNPCKKLQEWDTNSNSDGTVLILLEDTFVY